MLKVSLYSLYRYYKNTTTRRSQHPKAQVGRKLKVTPKRHQLRRRRSWSYIPKDRSNVNQACARRNGDSFTRNQHCNLLPKPTPPISTKVITSTQNHRIIHLYYSMILIQCYYLVSNVFAANLFTNRSTNKSKQFSAKLNQSFIVCKILK